MNDDSWAEARRQSERLVEEFAGVFSRESIETTMADSLGKLRDSRVRTYVPLLAYRFSRERLKALAQSQGLIVKENPEVLFVCVHNAGRSQMAAVLTADLSAGRVNVRSAGSAPANEINPMVVRAMEEIGLDLSQEFPKPLTDEVVQAADVVVTMGCGDACPLYPGKRYLDWQVDDPADQDLATVRRIRDAIRGHVESLLVELGVLSASFGVAARLAALVRSAAGLGAEGGPARASSPGPGSSIGPFQARRARYQGERPSR